VYELFLSLGSPPRAGDRGDPSPSEPLPTLHRLTAAGEGPPGVRAWPPGWRQWGSRSTVARAPRGGVPRQLRGRRRGVSRRAAVASRLESRMRRGVRRLSLSPLRQLLRRAAPQLAASVARRRWLGWPRSTALGAGSSVLGPGSVRPG
jgi:hypothetical protein